MKTVYFGHNPGYARTCNEQSDLLAVFHHSVTGNMTQRAEKMLAYCGQNSVKTFQHERQTPKVLEQVRTLQPDLIVVGEYHFILPKALVELPRLGAINLHGAPLPRYRGAHPINWMIINGETQGAVTCHYITEGLDDGDIIDQYVFPILRTDTAYDVRPRIEKTGETLLMDVLKRFRTQGRLPATAQDESKALYTPPRKPEDGIIDWNQPPEAVYNFVRALTRPYPGAFSYLHGQKVFIWKIAPPGDGGQLADGDIDPGTVMAVSKDHFDVAVASGTVRVTEWQSDSGGPGAHDRFDKQPNG